jgi:hypothetical protein
MKRPAGESGPLREGSRRDDAALSITKHDVGTDCCSV